MKKVLVLLLVLALVGGLYAQKKLVIGFAQEGAESGWRTAETDSVKATAVERGIDLKFSDAQGKQENQIKAIRSFIAQKVDGILLAPAVETGWEPVLTEAKKAKIPVVLLDRTITVSDPTLYVTFIGSDFLFEGAKAAELMAKKFNGKVNLVELQGSPGASPAILRQKGFADAIKASYPGMKIIKSQTGDFSRAGGKQVMEAFLKSDGDKIQAVYAHNDEMAVGAIQAIQEAGKVPGKDIYVISIDGTKVSFDAMVAGTLDAVVECNPLLGPLGFDALAKAMKGEKQDKWIKQIDGFFTKDQAAGLIAARKY